MGLAIVERMIPGFWFASVPAGNGPFPAILVLHSPPEPMAGWATRDATLFAAHGFVALPVHQDDVAAAARALRGMDFCSDRLGVFTLGAGAERLAAALDDIAPDAVAMHAPSPIAAETFANYPGPLFLSHGTADEYFPVETSHALEQAVAGTEAHYYEALDHVLNDESQANLNTERFITFFQRHLNAKA